MPIVPASPDHIDILTSIEVQSKIDSRPDCIDQIEIDQLHRRNRWASYFQKKSRLSAKPERIVLEALINNKMIGYIAGHMTSRHGLDAEIQSYYILQEYQRQGLGTGFFRYFISWQFDYNAKSLCVGIDPKNPHKNFYAKYGGTFLNEHWIIWRDLSSIKHQLIL